MGLTPRNKRVSGLGLTASGKRNILPGTAYERFFPKPLNVDPILNENGTVNDTVEYCAQIIYKTLGDTKHIARLLQGKTLNQTCKNIFDFLYKHCQYKQDELGIEQLRRPSRAFQDRKAGIDCDCFSISVSSILCNLNIFPHYLRIVKMYGRDYYQHIYVVVPKYPGADMSKRSNYYVIDPVVDKYDLEAPDITEIKDRKMTVQGMPIQYLNGVDTGRFGEEFNGLGDSLGDTDLNGLHQEYCQRCKKNLINTRNFMARNPHKLNHVYNVKGLIGAYDQLIGAWDNESERAAVLEKLSGTEELLLQPAFQGLGDIIHGSDDELFGLLNADLDNVQGLAGKKAKARKAATGSSTRKKKSGPFTKMKNANKASKGKKKGVLKKLGRNVFLKYNPAIIPIRAGFLVGMKTNALRIASRIYWALRPEEEALKAGVSKSFYQKAVKGLEFIKKIFLNKLAGSESALRKAIITGRAAKVAMKLAKKGKLNGFDGLMGVDGLGVVATATVAAAMTFLTSIAAFLTKVMGKKGDSATEESESGGETEATSSEASEAMQQTDPRQTIIQDGAESLYNRYVNKSGGGSPAAASEGGGDEKGASDDESDQEGSTQRKARVAKQESAESTPASLTEKPEAAEETAPSESKKGGGGMIVAALAVAAVAAVAMKSGKKKNETAVSGLTGIAQKTIKKKIISVKLT